MARGLVLWMQQAVVVPLGRLFGLVPVQRSYEGAKVTRRTSGWYAPSTGPNAEIQGDLVTLRNRHRSLVRDNPWAKRARDAIVNNVIGAGIVTQWSSPSRQQRWRDWWESTECDADGLTNGYGLQALVMRTLVESGEVLVYRRRRFGPRGRVPLQLQVREPDHLDHTRNESLPDGGRIVQGCSSMPRGGASATSCSWIIPARTRTTLGGPSRGRAERRRRSGRSWRCRSGGGC